MDDQVKNDSKTERFHPPNGEIVSNISIKEDAVNNGTSRAKYSDLPVDTGWAWVVCASTVLTSVLVAGFSRTTGVFFNGFMELYGLEKTDTAWLLSVFYLISYISAPVGVVLSKKFNARASMFVSAACGSFCLILTYIANDYRYLFFTYGILGGCFQGITMTSNLNALENYFNKFNSLAVGLMLAGGSLGGLVMPLLINYLEYSYTFKGMLLVLGGVYMNCFVLGSCLTPPAYFSPRTQKKTISVEANSVEMKSLTECDSSKEPQHSLSETQKAKKESTLKTSLKAFLKSELIRNPSLYILIIAFTFEMLGYVGTYILIPTYGKELKLEKNQRSFLISLMGLPDLIARILSGLLADYISSTCQKIIFVCVMLVQAALFTWITFMPSYETMLAFSVLVALFGGFAWTLTPVILRTTLGPHNMSTAAGITLFVNGPVLLIHPPILILINVRAGGWAWSYRYVSLLIIMSCIFLCVQLLYEKICKKDQKKRELDELTFPDP